MSSSITTLTPMCVARAVESDPFVGIASSVVYPRGIEVDFLPTRFFAPLSSRSKKGSGGGGEAPRSGNDALLYARSEEETGGGGDGGGRWLRSFAMTQSSSAGNVSSPCACALSLATRRSSGISCVSVLSSPGQGGKTNDEGSRREIEEVETCNDVRTWSSLLLLARTGSMVACAPSVAYAGLVWSPRSGGRLAVWTAHDDEDASDRVLVMQLSQEAQRAREMETGEATKSGVKSTPSSSGDIVLIIPLSVEEESLYAIGTSDRQHPVVSVLGVTSSGNVYRIDVSASDEDSKTSNERKDAKIVLCGRVTDTTISLGRVFQFQNVVYPSNILVFSQGISLMLASISVRNSNIVSVNCFFFENGEPISNVVLEKEFIGKAAHVLASHVHGNSFLVRDGRGRGFLCSIEQPFSGAPYIARRTLFGDAQKSILDAYTNRSKQRIFLSGRFIAIYDPSLTELCLFDTMYGYRVVSLPLPCQACDVIQFVSSMWKTSDLLMAVTPTWMGSYLLSTPSTSLATALRSWCPPSEKHQLAPFVDYMSLVSGREPFSRSEAPGQWESNLCSSIASKETASADQIQKLSVLFSQGDFDSAEDSANHVLESVFKIVGVNSLEQLLNSPQLAPDLVSFILDSTASKETLVTELMKHTDRFRLSTHTVLSLLQSAVRSLDLSVARAVVRCSTASTLRPADIANLCSRIVSFSDCKPSAALPSMVSPSPSPSPSPYPGSDSDPSRVPISIAATISSSSIMDGTRAQFLNLLLSIPVDARQVFSAIRKKGPSLFLIVCRYLVDSFISSANIEKKRRFITPNRHLKLLSAMVDLAFTFLSDAELESIHFPAFRTAIDREMDFAGELEDLGGHLMYLRNPVVFSSGIPDYSVEYIEL